MDDLIKHLAQARQIHSQYTAELVELEAEVREMVNERYGYALGRSRSLTVTAKADLDEAESLVRQAALDSYAGDGNKKPHPAIQVKLYTVLKYDQGDAVDFCRDSFPGALKLDKRAFEKVAKAMPLDFVVTEKEARATIASDLSEYVKQEAA